MSRLKIAIQKKGRLSDKSIELLKACGINISNGTSKLIAEASNFPIDVLFLRDDDIPQYVEQQVADVGILGENEVLEKRKDVVQVEKLGFAGCRLSLAIPKGESYTDLNYFNNKSVATSYPNILSDFFSENNIKATIEEIGGSVEIAPSIGLADAVCDIVSSGSTLFTNGLKEVKTVLKSEAVLIANKELSAEKQEILDRLLFRIRAVKRSSENKYILLNAPDKSIEGITNLLPGMKSPTVLPLAKKGWSSIHSVVKEDKFWYVIDQLRELGAEGILVIPIEKMVL
jgi:ATP phosphoribosyltransferase